MLLLTLIISLSAFSARAEENSAIVIGAGPSGIATTAKLLENGVKVTLLEAENRIGGRVNSVYFGDAYVDLGAEWCHGEQDNVVYNLVKDMEVLKRTDVHLQLYRSDGELVGEELSREINDIFEELYLDDVNSTAKEGQTVGQYFLERYVKKVNETFANDPKKLDFALKATELLHHFILSMEGAFHWDDVSAVSDYKESPGDFNLHWNGKGYKTILDVLMKKRPTPDPKFHIDETIRLNSKVHRVVWNKEDGVTLEVQGGRKFTAKHVVFTGSLGVLKDSHETLFSPQLPEAKKEAIQKLGIGAVMKVVMHFPQRFWKTDGSFTGLSFVWTDEDKKALRATGLPHGPMTENAHWIEDFCAILTVEKNDNVLTAWFTGAMLPQIEVMSDECIINGVMFTLNKFLGNTTIARPDRIIRSNWYSNPNFKGSWSFQTIESRKLNGSANAILSQALINEKTGKAEVFFAGEATNPIHFSTVHGAIESGHRAAEEVLKAMGKSGL